MRVITLNTQAIDSAFSLGFLDWVVQQDTDFICLQNLMLKDMAAWDDPKFDIAGFHRWASLGYSEKTKCGVAIYSRHVPKACISSLGHPVVDEMGRYLQIDFDHLSIVSVCVPYGAPEEGGISKKIEFLDVYAQHLKKQQRRRREFIICGGWNVIQGSQDVGFEWKEDSNQLGTTLEEIKWISKLKSFGLIDSYRLLDKEPGCYTYWRDRSCDETGMRVDYQMVSSAMSKTVINVGIYKGSVFSKHVPVIVDYEYEIASSIVS